jgi:hypothetical protein
MSKGQNERRSDGASLLRRLWLLDPEVLADLPRKELVDLVVPRHGGSALGPWLSPPGVIATLANERASILLQVAQQIPPLHPTNGSSL